MRVPQKNAGSRRKGGIQGAGGCTEQPARAGSQASCCCWAWFTLGARRRSREQNSNSNAGSRHTQTSRVAFAVAFKIQFPRVITPERGMSLSFPSFWQGMAKLVMSQALRVEVRHWRGTRAAARSLQWPRVQHRRCQKKMKTKKKIKTKKKYRNSWQKEQV